MTRASTRAASVRVVLPALAAVLLAGCFAIDWGYVDAGGDGAGGAGGASSTSPSASSSSSSQATTHASTSSSSSATASTTSSGGGGAGGVAGGAPDASSSSSSAAAGGGGAGGGGGGGATTTSSSSSVSASSSVSSSSGGATMCDQLYGSLPGYMLCSSTATDCTFYATFNGMDCKQICGSASNGQCLQAWDNTPGDDCTTMGHRACGQSGIDGICQCRP